MHPEPHTDLNNLNSMQHNLRNSAKESNDAYDVHMNPELNPKLNPKLNRQLNG